MENKELLLKDLSARLPYGQIVQISLFRNDGIKRDIDLDPRVTENIWEIIDKYHALPYLRSMSSMTEEERDEVEEISHGWFYINEDGEIFPIGGLTDSGEFEDAILPTFEYFLKNHIDYRGLIKKGLALEAPEGMYNMKEQ